MRRAATSIPSNIAEGYSRHSRKEYLQFLSVAYGSSAELGTHISISRDLEFIDMTEYETIRSLHFDVSRLLWKLMESLKNA
jgi:four helix bundle protein